MKQRVGLTVMVALLLSVALGGRESAAKEDKDSCAVIKDGVGYFFYLYDQLPVYTNLDPEAATYLRSLMNQSLEVLMQSSFVAAHDLHKEPSSLKDEEIVKKILGGAGVNPDDKKLAQAAAEKNLGIVFIDVAYSTGVGPKEGKSLLDTEELPAIEIKSGEKTYNLYNFIYLRFYIISSSNAKTIAKTKEMNFSYREWFTKKYPDFFSGASDELPPGVDYNSAEQYKAFIKESMQQLLDSEPDIKALTACKEKKP